MADHLTDNEMAAIAAGLPPTTDMHLTENLWRALENRSLSIVKARGLWNVLQREESQGFGVEIAVAHNNDLKEAVFAALVALYKAEHPE